MGSCEPVHFQNLLLNPLVFKDCTKEPLKFKIKCDFLEVVNPLIEIPNAAPAETLFSLVFICPHAKHVLRMT